MDVVITYVNGLDPVWREQYKSFIGREILAKRFRDWGTLKYLLRGIEKFMPYVDNVYLVVSGKSQVPQWADTDRLKIVTHDMFVPCEFLPTFNSNPLEMYLHRIPGLNERFIYFNDDMFPVRLSSEEDFFKGGKVVMSPSRNIFTFNMFKKICRNSDTLARKAAGLRPGIVFLRPQHSCAPMLKSVQEELFAKVRREIDLTASRKIRSSADLTQYLYSDYTFLTGHSTPGRLSNKHISMAASSIGSVKSFLGNPSTKFVCINDVNIPEETAVQWKEALISSFEKLFPQASSFEKK